MYRSFDAVRKTDAPDKSAQKKKAVEISLNDLQGLYQQQAAVGELLPRAAR
jgi:hypothetical protein